MAKKVTTVSKTQAFWVGEIDTYERQFAPWEKRCNEIVARYVDKRNDQEKTAARFNILWSNVQTLHPALYASPPTPNIDRRFDNDDDLGRYSALVLERAVSYYVKNDLFDKVMNQVTLDRLLPGRGVAWVRYCPVFDEKLQITDDTENRDYDEDAPDLLSEDTIPDYVHWKDFGHTWGRTWQEVRGVWRRVFMDRRELVKRFGKIGQTVPLDAEIKGKNNENLDYGKKATIYEIWDKTEKKAIWLHKTMEDILDEADDPLGLKDFFPCPEPIYSTLSNDNLIPSPDYIQYQDQACELDMLTARITAITKAVKVVGVYDTSAQGIDRLLSEGADNKLIPVDQWAVLGGGKGLPGAISFFPLSEIMQALLGLYQAREQVKQDLYEITGISDIVRGATNPNETLGAQELKGQFATLRLDNNQKDVARFAKDLVVIMTEVIAKHFSLDTIKQVSGVKLLTQEEKQQIQMQQQQAEQVAMQKYQISVQQAQATGQQPPPQPQPEPLPEDIEELMGLPTWEEIEGIIKDDTARNFRIDIETDSTIKTDQENEKKARVEFLSAVSNFMAQAVNIPPDLRELSMEMLMFGVRGFKVSRELETSFESAMREMRKAQENPQEPQPDPAVVAEQQKTQMTVQVEQMKLQNSQQAEQIKAQTSKEIEAGKAQVNMQIEQMKLENARAIEQMKLEYETQAESKRVAADITKAIIASRGQSGEDDGVEADIVPDMVAQLSSALNEGLLMMAQAQQQGNASVIQALQNPPPREVVRDASGNISGVR